MKLSEIQRDVIKEWLYEYLSDNSVEYIYKYIKIIDGKPVLKIEEVDLKGTGLPFVSPPFEIQVNFIKLSNYNFDDSTYANISTEDLVLNGIMNDLEKATKNVLNGFTRLREVQFQVFSDSAHNLVSAISLLDKEDTYYSIYSKKGNVSINTFDHSITINGMIIQTYGDVFDLQDILINRGFEAMV